MLPTAAVTILVLLASVLLSLAGVGAPPAVAHLAFAAGIVPLIFAAISHFVPVLTRTGSPSPIIRLLPAGAQFAGLLAVAAMQALLPRSLLHVAATLDLLLASVLLGWVVRRARACLGTPHPGWRWYGAALACLLLALAAVPVLTAIPTLYAPLRAIHLHLNTLGLVGLAALGTLPVLLPTALAKPDPEAAAWLRRWLWPALVGVLAVAGGSAFFRPAAVLGVAILLAVPVSLLLQWRRRFGMAALWNDGAAASLGAAAAGLVMQLATGAAHGAGLLAARPAIAAWGAGFLLPLVTGALSQLLPVWRWPGPATPARGEMRSRLAATGRWRALLFLVAGAALAHDVGIVGGPLAGAGLALFAVAALQAVRVKSLPR